MNVAVINLRDVFKFLIKFLIITLVLFTFYIFYYYFLENSTQQICEYYWKARDKK